MWLAALLIALLQTEANAAVDPDLSGTLSIIPGLGQVANGNALEGLCWFASSIGLLSSKNTYISTVGFKLWEYNMYDAYRDAGAHEASQETALENYIAFANPLNIVDPFSVGIVGVGALEARSAKTVARVGPRGAVVGALWFGFVGFGEEGLFRGFLYPAFSGAFDSHWVGATVSSAVFALSHLTNRQSYYHSAAGLSELFVLGMILCGQTTYKGYDLRHSIFSHAWYDILVDYASKGKSQSEPSEKLPGLGLKLSISI